MCHGICASDVMSRNVKTAAAEIEQQGSCHINNRKCKQEMCVMSTAAGERKVRNVQKKESV